MKPEAIDKGLQPLSRLVSIDIFRALTMLLMIFVNDLWTLHNIPQWLEHKAANEDGLGLADVVFPAFLFIVGLSIPFAIKSRRNKGDSQLRIFRHVIERTLALLVMGFFMVNLETFSEAQPLVKYIWEILMALAIILIWNYYEQNRAFGKIPAFIFQFTGILILIILAWIYRGGTPENPAWMRIQWWGILGLIGWSYLYCALFYLFIGPRVWALTLVWLFFNFLNIQEFIHLGDRIPQLTFLVSASNYASTMGGVLASVWFLRLKDRGHVNIYFVVLIVFAILTLAYGFATRPFWGISKIRATPSWTGICAGISFLFFALVHLIADKFKFYRWADILSPAGRSTLTCYLLPYIVYPVVVITGLILPQVLKGGMIGIFKSLLFALMIIVFTGLLEKVKIRLKI